MLADQGRRLSFFSDQTKVSVSRETVDSRCIGEEIKHLAFYRINCRCEFVKRTFRALAHALIKSWHSKRQSQTPWSSSKNKLSSRCLECDQTRSRVGKSLSELPVLHSQDDITDVDGSFLLVSCKNPDLYIRISEGSNAFWHTLKLIKQTT